MSYIDPKLRNRPNNVNIAIASAVTSYARVYMSKFKNRKDINLFYSDTDSLFTDSELPEEVIGNNIGQFKLENIFKEIIFLGPCRYFSRWGIRL